MARLKQTECDGVPCDWTDGCSCILRACACACACSGSAGERLSCSRSNRPCSPLMSCSPQPSHPRINSQPEARQRIGQSVPVNAEELFHRLELYKLEEEALKEYRRRSAGSLTSSVRATDGEALADGSANPFNYDSRLNEKLARSLAFHRQEAATTSAAGAQRPKSAYYPPNPFDADELTRRLEEFRRNDGKEPQDQNGVFSSTIPGSESGMGHAPPNTASDAPPARLAPVPIPAPLNMNRRTSTKPSTKRSKPRPQSFNTYIPRNASRSFSNTTSHRTTDPAKPKKPSPPISNAYTNVSRTSSDHHSRTSFDHYGAQLTRRATNDAPARRTDAPTSGVMAEAALYDQLRESKSGAKKLTRQEREQLLADRRVGEDGENTLRRVSTDTRRAAGLEQLASRISVDTEEAPPALPRTAHLEGYRHDWSQADAGSQGPGMFGGMRRSLSIRRGSNLDTDRAIEAARKPSAEHARWREKAMRQKAVMDANAKKLELEKAKARVSERSISSSARSKDTVHRPRSSKSDVTALPDVTADERKRMTAESLELLERQEKWLKRRTLEESALEQMARALPEPVARECVEELAPESAHAQALLQQEEAERQQHEHRSQQPRRQRHMPIEPKMEMEMHTEKSVDGGGQKKRSCFSFLCGSS